MSGGIRRNRDQPGYGRSFHVPGGSYLTVRGLIAEVETSQPIVEIGMEVDRVEACVSGQGINTGRVPVDPIGHRAIGIVIVGVHTRVPAHLVAVPSLPHGGGAMIDQVSPRGIFRIQQQAVGNIAVSGIHEYR